MSYDLFIVDKDVPEPEWFDVCERDGEHVRTAHGHYFNYTYTYYVTCPYCGYKLDKP